MLENRIKLKYFTVLLYGIRRIAVWIDVKTKPCFCM